MTTRPSNTGFPLLKWGATGLIALCIVLAFFAPLDKYGKDYLDSAFERSLLSFAVARGLNGVLSVAQGTEFAIQPAGVGINFSPGEILDPVNDLVERFSMVMLLSSSSLGMQKILLFMSGWIWLSIGFAVVALVYGASFWRGNTSDYVSRKILSRVFLFMFLMRFTVPVIALLNEWVFEAFLIDQYNYASVELKKASDEISSINNESTASLEQPEDENTSVGILGQAVRLYNSALEQVDFDKRLGRYIQAAEEVSENTINLIVVFVLQTIVFPLLFLWLLVAICRSLIRSLS